MSARLATTIELATEFSVALDMLLSVATDERAQLPKGELYTDIALNGARTALAKARAAGFLKGRSIAESPVAIAKDEKKASSYDLARTHVALGIRRLRKSRGYTQSQLAKKIGIQHAFISRLEDPAWEIFSYSMLIKVLDALDGELTITIEEIRV
jgi:DNA-binding XRE family transcriptional regulator